MGYDGMLCGDLNGGYMHYIDECVKAVINEMNDSNVDKSEIMSSFEPQTNLNEKIWLNNKLINSRVRLRLLDLADDFFDWLDIEWVEIKDIILTGSLANYNWSKFSDLDVHIIIDFKDVDEKVNFVSNYLNTKKKLWNTEHSDIKIYGFPVEMYVQDINELHKSSGIYSLEKNKWIVEPDKKKLNDISMNEKFINKKASEIIERINELEDRVAKEKDEHILEILSKKIKKLFDKIKGARRDGLKKSGEYNSFNILFKVLRRLGYIDKLYELKVKTYDKLKSIN